MEDLRVIFFTGAGVSTESGVPTFQTQDGIRDKLYRSFANEHPEEYRDVIRMMVDSVENAKPNVAHKAIAECGFPVITMNVDGLHTKAGSKNVIEVHGKLPTRAQLEEADFPFTYRGMILYEDASPMYEQAIELVNSLEYENSYFVIVGTSFYTKISETLYEVAQKRHAQIILINENATVEVPEICELLKKFF